MRIARIEYDLVVIGDGPYQKHRRWLDGSWETEEWSDTAWAERWRSPSGQEAERLEAEYQQAVIDQARNEEEPCS